MQRSSIQQPRATESKIKQPSSASVAKDDRKTDKSKKEPQKKEAKKAIEFQLPPLSIVGKKKEIDFEEIRKKVIRRGNPEGEDKKQLAAILKNLKESKAKIRVHEFVNLVSKYTSDNGEIMRKVMEEDLASFRKMVTKVYETMTQDVSDVLVNEQIQTANFYQERYDMYNNKVLWMISEIFQMIPDFEFERFAKDREDYLKFICPLPALIQRTAEDVDSQKRQEAFHRLQWLKIEEGRLAEENRRLEDRLNELKDQHKKETTEATMKSMIMEQKMHDLEDEEREKQEQLNELEGLLGKNIVRTEAYIRLEEDEAIRLAKPATTEVPEKKLRKIERKKDDWPSATARQIEQEAAKKAADAESARADEKKRMRRREREPGRQTTLITEREPADYPEFPSASVMQEKNIQQVTTTIHEKRIRPPRVSNIPKGLSRAQPRGGGRCTGGCKR